MTERLRQIGDKFSTLDESLSEEDQAIADVCMAAARSLSHVVAAYALAAAPRIGAKSTQVALFNALVSQAAEALADGIIVSDTKPEAAIDAACDSLRSNFEIKLREARASYADFLADEARGATKQ